ncbi:hypothetical protein [Bacillus toyonensis]|uniref:hypothetical protein n=1 Tax=Bacillus toyonensis TaxID=155322 RepID=UPI002E233D5C|nr:hypothetical protein [Bacillus toyonensis]
MIEQKLHIDVEKLTELTAEQILNLSNHKMIDTVWQDWSTVEKIEDALEAFRKKGWKHSTLVETAEHCNMANMLAILHNNGKVNIQNIKNDKEFYWLVSFVSFNGGVSVESKDEEICDALWAIVLESNLLNLRLK